MSSYSEKHGWLNTLQTIISGLSVAGLVWLANTVICHGKNLAEHGVQIQNTSYRLSAIESRGSGALADYAAVANKRLDKLEATVQSLQDMRVDVQTILVHIENMRQAQARMEKALEQRHP